MSQRDSGAARRSRPNIVFILIDDLRWDELGIAGHPYIKTPNIDRIGKEGALVVVDEKAALMRSLGTKRLIVHLAKPLSEIPPGLAAWPLELNGGGSELQLTYDAHEERTGVSPLLQRLAELGVEYRDVETRQTSLEEIFVKLVATPA